MGQAELIPHLFRTEYSKIIAVLTKLFGLEHIETAEDIASDTFLRASELWSINGLPENPVAWLYAVAKNKAINYLNRDKFFRQKIIGEIKVTSEQTEEIDIDLSTGNIADSQLQMMFAACHPSIPSEAQIGLALRILCGFGIEEIAAAFLTNKETINKRLHRAKTKLREENVAITLPPQPEIQQRLSNVLTTLYLLFNEGYYSSVQDTLIRKDLCLEAIRLTTMLTLNKQTSLPAVFALLALMNFQSSRFNARTDANGETVLYHNQDDGLWDKELIKQGEYFLNQASTGSIASKYHYEAGIAYWHTIKQDSPEKWEHILQLYNQLLVAEYSPIAALNRTYALSKARSKELAIIEAEKLKLEENHLYHSLLGELYTGINNIEAVKHLQTALSLTKSQADKHIISAKLDAMVQKEQRAT